VFGFNLHPYPAEIAVVFVEQEVLKFSIAVLHVFAITVKFGGQPLDVES